MDGQDVVNIFVQMMRLSPVPEEEQHVLQAEELARRQFLLMEQQGEVRDPFSVRPMETWLLTKRDFLYELRAIFKLIQDELFLNELDWTRMMNLCVPLTEENLLELRQTEKELSKLAKEEVSLGALYVAVLSFSKGAEASVRFFLHSMYRELLQVFLGVIIPMGPIPAGDIMGAKLLHLEWLTAPVVPLVLKTALKLLLEDEEQGEQEEAASTEIGQLLVESIAPYFPHNLTENGALLHGICSTVALFTFRTIRKRFNKHWKFVEEMEDVESRLSAIVEMTKRRQTDSFSRAHDQLSSSSNQAEDLGLGKDLPLDEEMATTPENTSEDTSIIHPATTLTLSCDQRPEDLPPSATSDQAPFEDSTSEAAEYQPAEEMGASPHVTATEELAETLLESREASIEVTATVTPTHETEDTSEVEEDTNISEDIGQEIPQQETVDSSETQEALSEDGQRKKRRKKRGVRAFLGRVWKSVTCCSCASTDE